MGGVIRADALSSFSLQFANAMPSDCVATWMLNRQIESYIAQVYDFNVVLVLERFLQQHMNTVAH
jgi:hypothetical protein